LSRSKPTRVVQPTEEEEEEHMVLLYSDIGATYPRQQHSYYLRAATSIKHNKETGRNECAKMEKNICEVRSKGTKIIENS
jgi:hypothetical protein